MHRRNCVGCHIIEGDGGDFVKLVADPSLGSADADAGRRARAARLAVCVSPRTDHDPAVAERAYADVRPRRSQPERRDPVLRCGLEHDRSVPDARDGADGGDDEHRRRGQAAVRAAEVPAVPRARRDSEGSADREPGAGSADDSRAPEPGLDSRLAEEAVGHPARHTHAGVLAGLSEVVLPAARRHAETQIRAIRDHLLTFRGGPSPKTNGAKVANNNN